jgi:hypothetical protein
MNHLVLARRGEAFARWVWNASEIARAVRLRRGASRSSSTHRFLQAPCGRSLQSLHALTFCRYSANSRTPRGAEPALRDAAAISVVVTARPAAASPAVAPRRHHSAGASGVRRRPPPPRPLRGETLGAPGSLRLREAAWDAPARSRGSAAEPGPPPAPLAAWKLQRVRVRRGSMRAGVLLNFASLVGSSRVEIDRLAAFRGNDSRGRPSARSFARSAPRRDARSTGRPVCPGERAADHAELFAPRPAVHGHDADCPSGSSSLGFAVSGSDAVR